MIRAAKPTDAAQICAFWNPEIRNTLITFNSIEKTERDVIDMIAAKEAEGYASLVVEEESTILGFATYGQFRGGIGYRHTAEHTIVLSDAARGMGLGRARMSLNEPLNLVR